MFSIGHGNKQLFVDETNTLDIPIRSLNSVNNEGFCATKHKLCTHTATENVPDILAEGKQKEW